ncbi:hypothetical protein KJ980_05450 [Patescibacteria group bacterium]|nr:hypothetical protein [Patescibacteria group bacterium]MBU4016486.1 hypothetical protein [Patescibacteria group bacterium]MBU4099066.1 hypothetical protein [Patescibacteria group bacterium]
MKCIKAGRIRTILILFILFITSLIFTSMIYAFDAPRIYVKELNINKTSFNAGDSISGDFLMWNTTDGIAADLDYKISLIKDRQVFGEQIFPVSEQIYPDKTYKQNFTYAIPANISSGRYIMMIRLYMKTGMPLNWGEKEITISGNDNMLRIINAKLMQGDKEFGVGVGVNFDPNEDPPKAVFSADNPSDKSIEYDLKVIVYAVQSNMEEKESFSAKKGILSSKQNKDFSITLPKYDTSGTYLAKIAFYENNILVSNEESFRWVIKGPSARILKVESGEDFFQKDKIVKITVDFVGPSDGSSLEGANLTVSIFGKDGKVMASSNRDIRPGSNVSSEFFDLMPSADVLSPRIEAKIVKDGKVLDSYTTEIKTAGDTDESVVPIQSQENESSRIEIFSLVLIMILLLVFIIILKFFENKKIFMFILLTISFAAGMGIFYAVKINNTLVEAEGLDDLAIIWNEPINDSVYNFGGNISFSGEANVAMCINGVSSLSAESYICDRDDGSGNCVQTDPGDFVSVIPKGLVRIKEGATDYVYVLDAGGRVMKYKESNFGAAGTIPAPVAVLGGSGSGNRQFKDPNSIIYDSVSGYIYVADTGNNRIVKFNPSDFAGTWRTVGADRVTKINLQWIESPAGSGNWVQDHGTGYNPLSPPLVTISGGGGGSGATAEAMVTGSGKVWAINVTNVGSGYLWDPNITIARPAVGKTAHAYATRGFTSPISVFYDSAGAYLYVTERGSNNRIVRFKPSNISGTFRAFGNGWGVGKGYFRSPGAVFYDKSTDGGVAGAGYIYVAGGWGSQIIRFKAANMTGTWQKIGADSLTTIRVDNGGSGYTSIPIVAISGGGAITNATATATLGTGADSDKVVSITVDTGGMGYTSEPSVAINGGGGSGATATTWDIRSFAGSGVGQFGNPKGVYYDSGTDYIYVSGGDSVVRVKATGNMISGSRVNPVTDWTDFGEYGSGTGRFNLVRGTIYNSATENIYTADEGNYRVVKLKEAEEFATATAIISGGAVTDINITDKGEGYTSVPVVTISGGGGSGATAVVDKIAGKKVRSIAITNGGSGYTSAPTVTISKIGDWSEIDFTPPTSNPDFFPYRIDTTVPVSFSAPFALGPSGEAFAKVIVRAVDGEDNFYETESYAPIFITTPPPTYTVSGNIFIDVNKNKLKDGGESNYAAAAPTITINPNVGTINTLANGTYTITNLPAGTYTVSYTSLSAGYFMVWPKPPSFQVTVGPSCNVVNSATGGECY